MSLKPKPVDFDETWAGLKQTISAVVILEKVNRAEWNDRFTDVYSLCVAYPEPYINQLYNETRVFLQNHVRQLVREIENENCTRNGLIKTYYEMWIKYSQGIEFLNKLYSYLNQQHVKKSKLVEAEIAYGGLTDTSSTHMVEIGELGLEIWRTEMLEKIQKNLIELVLDAIRTDRKGESAVATTIVNGVIHSFVAVEDPKNRIPGDPSTHLTFYEKTFEAAFLRDTGQYYQQEAVKLCESCSVSEYMDKVIHKLHEEDMRARRYLHATSYTKVSAECHRRLVADHLPIIHGECKSVVEGDRRKDMSNMYCLLKPLTKGLAVLADIFEKHVRKVGLDAIDNLKQETAPIDFVENLTTVYKKYKDIVNIVFNSDQLFISALDKACTSVINYKSTGGTATAAAKTSCRSPELLAKYCDSLLKKSTKAYAETEVDEKLGQSIIIFKYIDDKDVFQKFYARNLARRLIHQLSHSMDSEEGMINRLKQACGYEFTNKLHRMFTDVSVSQDLNNKFNDYLYKKGITLGISFNMLVLQAGAWPLQQNPSPFAVPQILERSVQTFEAFYANQFNGRKLTWLHHLSSSDVKISYTKRTYFITMQTFQLAILLQFETHDMISFQELQVATQLSDDQLSRHLISLLECKLLDLSQQQVPAATAAPATNNASTTETTTTAGAEGSSSGSGGTIEPSSSSVSVPSGGTGPEFTPETIISLNKNYSNKRARFRISAAVQKETPQEIEQTHVSVEEDRKIYIQAAIVRIMKSRKVIKHNVLIQEVLTLFSGRFSPTIAIIKKCIETLIERQYLERTPNSTDEYSYVA